MDTKSFNKAVAVVEALENSVKKNKAILLSPHESRILATMLVDLMSSYDELVKILMENRDKELQDELIERSKDVQPAEA